MPHQRYEYEASTSASTAYSARISVWMTFVPVLYWVTAALDVGASGPGSEAGLCHLHGRLLVLNALLQQLNVLLHVEDFLQYLITMLHVFDTKKTAIR